MVRSCLSGFVTCVVQSTTTPNRSTETRCCSSVNFVRSKLNIYHAHRGSGEPDIGSHQVNEGGEAGGELLIASGNAPKLLQAREEALHKITVLVLGPVNGTYGLTVRELRNHGFGAQCPHVGNHCRGVIAPVRSNARYPTRRPGGDLVEQRLTLRDIVTVATGQEEGGEIAQALYCCVNLGGESTTRAAKSLRTVFFRAPLACW